MNKKSFLKKRILGLFLLVLIVFLFLYFKNDIENLYKSDLNYNDLMSYDMETTDTFSYYKTGKEGEIIEWKGKISNYYTQITGIKFCIVDEEHQNVDINKPCNMFWAFSDDLIDADDISINSDWDGQWVNYILNYYNVDFNENADYSEDVYMVKGIIKGIDCAPSDKCSPDIEIINIRK